MWQPSIKFTDKLPAAADCSKQTGRTITSEGPSEASTLLQASAVCRNVLIFTCVCCCLQWQSLIKDLQAEEEHPRGLPPVWAAETCRGDAGQWESEAGCHAARGRGSQWVDCCQQWVDDYNRHIYSNRAHCLNYQFSFFYFFWWPVLRCALLSGVRSLEGAYRGSSQSKGILLTKNYSGSVHQQCCLLF